MYEQELFNGHRQQSIAFHWTKPICISRYRTPTMPLLFLLVQIQSLSQVLLIQPRDDSKRKIQGHDVLKRKNEIYLSTEASWNTRRIIDAEQSISVINLDKVKILTSKSGAVGSGKGGCTQEVIPRNIEPAQSEGFILLFFFPKSPIS